MNGQKAVSLSSLMTSSSAVGVQLVMAANQVKVVHSKALFVEIETGLVPSTSTIIVSEGPRMSIVIIAKEDKPRWKGIIG